MGENCGSKATSRMARSSYSRCRSPSNRKRRRRPPRIEWSLPCHRRRYRIDLLKHLHMMYRWRANNPMIELWHDQGPGGLIATSRGRRWSRHGLRCPSPKCALRAHQTLSLDMNQDFTHALRALLAIAYNQSRSRPTFTDEIVNGSTAEPSSMLSIIDTLVSAGIVDSRANVCTLLRSPSSLTLHEIYSITTPVGEGNSSFAQLYASLTDRATSAVRLEFGDLDLQQSLARLLGSMDGTASASRQIRRLIMRINWPRKLFGISTL